MKPNHQVFPYRVAMEERRLGTEEFFCGVYSEELTGTGVSG
jgi:hypothetical protein